MKERTRGAWIVNHTNKLRRVEHTVQYERIDTAGRAGILLAAIAEGETAEQPTPRVHALAQANGINTREVGYLLEILQNRHLIDRDGDCIQTLGVTSDTVLEHTSRIFLDQQPETEEIATLELAEAVSDLPVRHADALEFLGDTFHVNDPKAVIEQSVAIGFIDSERANREPLYFNGNLFKRESAKKAEGVLSTLTPEDQRRMKEADDRIAQHGCIPFATLQQILGQELFDKLGPLGFYDLHEVANEEGASHFITKPAAFRKFGGNAEADPFVDDALDMAKALVACLTYGMLCRPSSQGRISYVDALLRKLISGVEVGPATAIGHDYRALENRGVVRTRDVGGGMFCMRLLKPDVGQMARNVLSTGDTSHEALNQFPGAAVTRYRGPEETREVRRKHQNPQSDAYTKKLLHTIRTGGLS